MKKGALGESAINAPPNAGPATPPAMKPPL